MEVKIYLNQGVAGAAVEDKYCEVKEKDKGISVEPFSLLIGTALALFRKGRAKGGT